MTLPFVDDMAASAAFSPSQPCAGGEHIQLAYTLIVDGVTVARTLSIQRSRVKQDALTAEDADQFMYLLARILARQVPLAQVRTTLVNTTVNLTAAGA